MFGVKPQKVKDWAASRVKIPEGVWQELAQLEDQIDLAVDDAFQQLKDQPLDKRMLMNCTVAIDGAPNSCESAAGARLVLALLNEQTE